MGEVVIVESADFAPNLAVLLPSLEDSVQLVNLSSLHCLSSKVEIVQLTHPGRGRKQTIIHGHGKNIGSTTLQNILVLVLLGKLAWLQLIAT